MHQKYNNDTSNNNNKIIINMKLITIKFIIRPRNRLIYFSNDTRTLEIGLRQL